MACVPSKDSDQPGHPTQSDQSLSCPHEESLSPQLPTECTARILLRLVGCPGWSKSSLGAHAILLVLSWDGSNEEMTGAGAHQNQEMTRVLSKDSDQTVHPSSLISLGWAHEEVLDPDSSLRWVHIIFRFCHAPAHLFLIKEIAYFFINFNGSLVSLQLCCKLGYFQ